MAITYLPPEVFNKVWVNFLEANVSQKDMAAYRWARKKYSPGNRDPMSKKFEQWLFDQGSVVRRRNKQFYLEFIDEDAAVMFALRRA
jgi:hypothetical protein